MTSGPETEWGYSQR